MNKNETKSRNIFLYGNISDESIKGCVEDIIEINEEDASKESSVIGFERTPIKLYVNSYGGDYEPALALMEIIMSSETPVHTICTGLAASSAFNIFLAGRKRFATKRAHFLYHQLSLSPYHRTVTSMEQRVARTRHLQEDMHDYIVKRTGIEADVLKKYDNENADWSIDMDEALRLNIVTDFIGYV